LHKFAFNPMDKQLREIMKKSMIGLMTHLKYAQTVRTWVQTYLPTQEESKNYV